MPPVWYKAPTRIQMDAVEAVRAGSRAALDEVFRKGGDLDAVDKNGATALIVAADSGRLDLLKFLLQCGVSLNAQDKFGQTALMVAAGKADVYSVKHLLAAGANPNLVAKNGLTALRCAVDAGAREAARLIKQAGAR